MYKFLAKEIMNDMIKNLTKSWRFQIVNFLEVVKVKAIEAGVVHDGLLTILTLIAISYLMVVFAGHLWNNIKKKNGKLQCIYTRSMSIGVLHGGELALERLVHYHEAKAHYQILLDANSETELVSLLNEALPDFKKLQRCVARLEMSGKEREPVKNLEFTVTEARSNGKPHEVYEFEMLLVETLIYKAIIYHSLGNTIEAKNSWVVFKRIRKLMKRSSNEQDAQLFEITKDFDKFKSVVESLRKDIKEAKVNAK